MSCDNIHCNQGRNCTCAHPTVCPNHATPWAGCTCGPIRPAKAPRSCDELGMCQGRNPPCPGCTHTTARDTSALPPGGFWFAPGTIDRTPPRRERWSWLEISMAAICVSGVIGFLAGVGTMWWKGLL